MKPSKLGIRGSGFGFQDWNRGSEFGFEDWGLGVRDSEGFSSGPDSPVPLLKGFSGTNFSTRVAVFGIRDPGFGFWFRVSEFGVRVLGFGIRVRGFGFRNSGFEIWDLGFGFGVRVPDFVIRVDGGT